MSKLLLHTECKWVTATNGDNAYGSRVVDRILHAAPQPGSTTQPDMVLLPMDSRNFANHGKHRGGDRARRRTNHG